MNGTVKSFIGCLYLSDLEWLLIFKIPYICLEPSCNAAAVDQSSKLIFSFTEKV